MEIPEKWKRRGFITMFKDKDGITWYGREINPERAAEKYDDLSILKQIKENNLNEK